MASTLLKRPRPENIPGCRYAAIGGAAPLGERTVVPPNLGRVGLIAFWDDRAALDAFLADDPLAAALDGGWHVQLRPVNVHEYHRTRGTGSGTWPGIDDPWLTGTALSEGPMLSLTLAETKITRTPRTLAATIAAGKPLWTSPGFLWGDGTGEAAHDRHDHSLAISTRHRYLRLRPRRQRAPARHERGPTQSPPPPRRLHPFPASRITGPTRGPQLSRR